MESFELAQPQRLDDALALLAEPGAVPLAGGTDLLDRMKEHLDTPRLLVSLKGLKLDAIGAAEHGGGLRVGALATLASVAGHPTIRQSYPALAAAAAHAATPNLRNVGTVGGSLLQRPRCWYLRNELFACRRRGGSTCYAHEGENQLHALFDNGICAAIHASTLATPLLAYDAQVVIASSKGQRQLPLAELFVSPSDDATRENVLQPGELLTEIVLDLPPAGSRSAYFKQGQRESYDWPLADVAVALVLEAGVVKQARVALGAAAPTPMRATAAEERLVGGKVDAALAKAAADAAMKHANPLAKNRYKVDVFRAVIARTLLAAAEGSNP
jgi:xanthine dehydrogenase YagS FAD-binding subunit